MQKKEIAEKKRRAAAAVLIFMATAAAAALVLFGIIGPKVNKTAQVASYSSKSEIEYNVNFADNPYYNEENVEFGSACITKFVNNIDLALLYGFSCSEATGFQGSYSATALLEATYNDSDLIWRKEFRLVPQTNFKTEQVSESVSLPLKEYVELVKNLQETTGVITSVIMTVTYTVNASALIGGETIADTSEATLVFPVTGDVLVMGGTPLNEQSKTIEAEVPREILPKDKMFIGSIVLLIFSGVALITLLLFTKGIKPDPVELQLNRILKKYSGRIVELHSGDRLDSGETVCVESFRDLLLTADELKKPIFKISGEKPIDTEFFVFDEPVKYVLKAGYSKAVFENPAECVK